MKLTDFHKTKRGRIAIYLEGEFALSMHPDVFADARLAIGDEIDQEQLQELSERAELKKAKEKALNLLSYKEYTYKQMVERLERTTQPEIAQQAAERMQELGLIDDDDYACRFARDLYIRKRYGIMRIKQELYRRGLSAEQIEEALMQLPDEDMQNIRAIIERKYPRWSEDEAVKRRAFNALARMGYRLSDVRRALREDDIFD